MEELNEKLRLKDVELDDLKERKNDKETELARMECTLAARTNDCELKSLFWSADLRPLSEDFVLIFFSDTEYKYFEGKAIFRLRFGIFKF